MSTAGTRIGNALNDFRSQLIELDVAELGVQIMRVIKDVGQLQGVRAEDLMVFGESDGKEPTSVKNAMEWGTKFFDAVYFFAVDTARRPKVIKGTHVGGALDGNVMLTKKRLLWTAIFLMLRGSYPESVGKVVGTDVPAFLVNICGMNESPADCASGLASFDLKFISPDWIRQIKWKDMAAPIKQRLALGLAGYRSLAPFKMYDCRDDASAEVKAAFDWVRQIAVMPVDYSILSCTRDAGMVSRMGSWNAALGNLSLLCFTRAQLEEMEQVKILYRIPDRDPRADTWKSWVAGGPLPLNDPVGLN